MVTLVTGVFYLSSWIQWRLVIKQLKWDEFNVSKKTLIGLFIAVKNIHMPRSSNLHVRM